MRVQIKRLQLNKMDYHFFLPPGESFRNGGGVGGGGGPYCDSENTALLCFNTTSKLFKKYFKASKFVSFA